MTQVERKLDDVKAYIAELKRQLYEKDNLLEEVRKNSKALSTYLNKARHDVFVIGKQLDETMEECDTLKEALGKKNVTLTKRLSLR